MSTATTPRSPKFVRQVVAAANRSIRSSIGLTQDPPPICDDTELAYFPVDGIARLVHGDLAAMLAGGIGSLFYQMLHPYAMAGVAQHSRYQDDPLGRMLQTANFIGFTTYGTKATAAAAIERVLAVHEAVRGVADDGTPYYANDPHLLLWVHCAEISMFLEGYLRYGPEKLTRDECDNYVSEVARIARDMGVPNPPNSYDELQSCLQSFAPELRLSADGAVARDWLRRGVMVQGWQRAGYRLVVRASFLLLPPTAQSALGVRPHPVMDALFTRPLMKLLAGVMHRVVPPVRRA